MHHNILITGGAGFIGSRVITALLKSEPACRIWVLDNINSQVYDFKSKLSIFSGGVEFVRGNATKFFINSIKHHTPCMGRGTIFQ